MFVKITNIKDYCYIKIVESYRDEQGITRHSTICNFGRLDRLKKDKSFRKSIKKLNELLEENAGTPEEISDGTIENAPLED